MGQTETERTTLRDEKADTANGIRFSESYAAGHNAFWRWVCRSRAALPGLRVAYACCNVHRGCRRACVLPTHVARSTAAPPGMAHRDAPDRALNRCTLPFSIRIRCWS